MKSIATLYWLEKLLGKKPGGSTGTNMWGALNVASRMQEQGLRGSIATLMCDSGERYLDTCYDRDWVARTIVNITPYAQQLDHFL